MLASLVPDVVVQPYGKKYIWHHTDITINDILGSSYILSCYSKFEVRARYSVDRLSILHMRTSLYNPISCSCAHAPRGTTLSVGATAKGDPLQQMLCHTVAHRDRHSVPPWQCDSDCDMTVQCDKASAASWFYLQN